MSEDKENKSKDRNRDGKSPDKSNKDESKRQKVDLLRAGSGGFIVLAITLVGIFLVGRTSGAEARQLLEALFPTTRFLSSAVMTATATILALMLTLLSISTDSTSQLKRGHYERIKQIAFVDTIGLVLSTTFLILHCVPLQKTDKLPNSWFEIIYYVVLITSAILGGLLVSVVLMLYNTLRDMISVVGLGDEDHSLIAHED